MAAIKSRGNKDTELKLLAILRIEGIKGWRRQQPLYGKPDFIFRKERLAVFVDGCFWHGCPKHGRRPGSNSAYWVPKLARNQKRDAEVNRVLRKQGWKVFRLWEHELSNQSRVASTIVKLLRRRFAP
jgi:DNA mismatch endonuclease (patch repair protein)